MSDKFKPRPGAVFDAEVRYEFSKVQLIEILRTYTGLLDADVEFDISHKGFFRSVTVKVKKSEIQR